MPVKLPKKRSKKKKKLQVEFGRLEVLLKLGLEPSWTTPLEQATMLDISTWSLENQVPVVPEHLPYAFLQRLWLLISDARSPNCQPPDAQADATTLEVDYGFGDDSEGAIHPLDLVTAVYLYANSLLQQEITVRMVQCQFAVPMVLPTTSPEQSCFLLWPLRGVVSQWKPHSLAKTKKVLEGDLASTKMPLVSCVKLGQCGVSKSRVLSLIMGSANSVNQIFFHRGMDGGQLPRNLANGLVELGWSLPSGNLDQDNFPVPLVISNLRGDAASHEKCMKLLCRASSAVVVFCGNLKEKEKHILASWKTSASKLILIDLSDTAEEGNENRVVGFIPQDLEKELRLPKGTVLSGRGITEEELAGQLQKTLNGLLPDKLEHVTLEAAASIAVEVGMLLDEGAVCKKAMAAVEEVLKGLEHGSAQYREAQLPLQGALWSRLTELEKEQSKQIKSGEGIDQQQQTEKKGIVQYLRNYRMTTAMKVFTEALFTTNKMERGFFLSWMKLRLRAMQMRQCTRAEGFTGEANQHASEDAANGVNDDRYDDDADSFWSDSTESLTEEVKWRPHLSERRPLEFDHREQSALPEQGMNLEPVVEVHMTEDPAESSGPGTTICEQQIETHVLDHKMDQSYLKDKELQDPAHADAEQGYLYPEAPTEQIMELESDEKTAFQYGAQVLNKDHTENNLFEQQPQEDLELLPLNDEQVSNFTEVQTEEVELKQIKQTEEEELGIVFTNKEQLDVDFTEYAKLNMDPCLEEKEGIEQGPEALNVDNTENHGRWFDYSEDKPEKGRVEVLEMVQMIPTNEELDSNDPEEQTEKQDMEISNYPADQNEKEMLDYVLPDLDLSENETVDVSTEIEKLDLFMDHTKQTEEQGLELVHGFTEQLDLDIEECIEENMKQETNEEASILSEKQTLRHADDSDVQSDPSVQLDIQGLNLEPELDETGNPTTRKIEQPELVNLDVQQVAFDIPDEDSTVETPQSDQTEEKPIKAAYFEEQAEQQDMVITIDQTGKEQLAGVLPVSVQSNLNISEKESPKQEVSIFEPMPTYTYLTENVALNFDSSEKEPEQSMNLGPVPEQHMAIDLPGNNDQESKFTEEQSERQKMDSNMDHNDQTEQLDLEPANAYTEQLDLDLEETAQQIMEKDTEANTIISSETQTLSHTENTGPQTDTSVQQLDQELELNVAGDIAIHDDQELGCTNKETENENKEINMDDEISDNELTEQDKQPVPTEKESIKSTFSDEQTEEEQLETQESDQTEDLDIVPLLEHMDLVLSGENSQEQNLESQSMEGQNLEPLEEVQETGISTAHDGGEALNYSDQKTKTEFDESMGQTNQMEKVQLVLLELSDEDQESGSVEYEPVEPEPEPLNIIQSSDYHFDLPEKQLSEGPNLEEQLDLIIPDAYCKEKTVEAVSLESQTNENETWQLNMDDTVTQSDQQLSQEPVEEEHMSTNPVVNVMQETMQMEEQAGIQEVETKNDRNVELENGQLDTALVFEDGEPIMEERPAEREVIEENGTWPLNVNHFENLSSQNQTCDPAISDPFIENYFEPDPSSLGLEHFLREMGLIFELTYKRRGVSSHKVLRLPSLAADLLLYGIPLEIMDGDASNVPQNWLNYVLADLNHRMPLKGVKVRVLTSLGISSAKNSEVLSALFAVTFPKAWKRTTRGVYMLPLWLPDDLRMNMECDLLIMVDVEGLCSPGFNGEKETFIHDNEMATIATGMSDVLMHNIVQHRDTEDTLNVIINALLRTEECGYIPISEFLTQDEGLNTKWQALHLQRITEILQTETEETDDENTRNTPVNARNSILCLKGPWQNISLSVPVDKEYSENVIQLKRNLFAALEACASKSEAAGLPEFMGRLWAVWESVKAESFSTSLQSTDMAKAFSMLCTELSIWEKMLQDHMEVWFAGATTRIISSDAEALETGIKAEILQIFKDEARAEVKTQVDQIRSKIEAYLKNNDLHNTNIETYGLNLMNNMNELEEQVTKDMIERLTKAKENYNSSVRLQNFQNSLEKEQEDKLRILVETSKSTDISLNDIQIEEEFKQVWNNALSNFDLRHLEVDNITARVKDVLKDNLISRGLQQYIEKLENIKNTTSGFTIYIEHFDFHSKLHHIKKQQYLRAHYVVHYIIEEYNHFVAEKASLESCFSDTYITELLEHVETILMMNPLEISPLLEVDLKVYLCSFACEDFQEQHDSYIKNSLMAFSDEAKDRYMGLFTYQFRKRDQCQRVAQAFTSMVFKPTALDYVYKQLGGSIVQEMLGREEAQQYMSPQAFSYNMLVELLIDDNFECFLEYLQSYESFCLGKIQRRVVAHLSESTIITDCRQQQLEEIMGKINGAVSQTEESLSGVLSDTKLLLEKICLDLEKDGDVDVNRECLDGQLFSVTTEWDHFVTCLLEAVAGMHLNLTQEFSQNTDVAQFLQVLPIKPQDLLFDRVRGCGRQCPLCKAPCEMGELHHEVHTAIHHRPKGLLSYVYNDTGIASDDAEDHSLAYKDYSDWSICPEEAESQIPSAYWRYVLVRFNTRLAAHYNSELVQLPEEWENVTQEEALESLQQTFNF